MKIEDVNFGFLGILKEKVFLPLGETRIVEVNIFFYRKLNGIRRRGKQKILQEYMIINNEHGWYDIRWNNISWDEVLE